MSTTFDYGIDLGTTNSVIAKFAKGKVEILKDPMTWQETIPSVVGFRKGRILVGNSAQTYLPRDPENVVSRFKRRMGTGETFEIESLGESISPVQLSAHVLRALKTHVQDGGKIGSAVITVPASFGIVQSNATIEAGREAGLSEVLLLQEPIAASLAYANLSDVSLENTSWLVYDLGGGTFDVALLRNVNGELRVVDHEGDNFLGGSDFDQMIVERFAIQAIEEQFEEVDMQADFQSASGKYNSLFFKLLEEAERAKKELSTAERAEINFEFDNEDVDVEISRLEFEELLKPEIDRTVVLVEKILARNRDVVSKIDFLLMVGGSTYIPYVRKSIEESLGVPVRTDFDPTTAVAIGAAFYAGSRDRAENLQKEEVSNLPIRIRAVYERASNEVEELFAARVVGETDGIFYRIRRADGGFDTGLRPLEAKISEMLPLVRDSFNQFSFHVYDSESNNVAVDFSEIGIFHGHRVEGQKLSMPIWLEFDTDDGRSTYLQKIIERNALLPARRSTKVRTTRQVAQDRSDSLLLNVYQGDVEILPLANKLVGKLQITGEDLNSLLRDGAELDVRIELTESQQLSVIVSSDEAELEKQETFNLLSDLIVDVDKLQEGLGDLRYKALKQLEDAEALEDREFQDQLQNLHGEIDALEDRSLELTLDDSTDQKYQFDGEMRRLAGDLQSVIEQFREGRAIDDYLEWKKKCLDAVETANDEKLLSFFSSITADDALLIKEGSLKVLAVKAEQLEDLYWSAMWRQPEFITERFNGQLEFDDDVTDSVSFRKLTESGQIALIDGDYDKLREVTFKMHELRRKRGDKSSGKTGISL